MSFFEEFGENLIKFGNSAGNKIKETTDSAFSNVEKKARMQELNAVFMKLGKAYFNKEVYGAVSYDIDELLNQAEELDRVIRGLEDKMGMARGEKICVNCKAVIKSGSAFCPICGSKQVAGEAKTMEKYSDNDEFEDEEVKTSVEVAKAASTDEDDIFED